MEDWDLQAVVRGCRGGAGGGGDDLAPATPAAAAMTEMVKEPFAFFSRALLQEDDGIHCLPDLLAAQACMQELEELCRPFCPETRQPVSPESATKEAQLQKQKTTGARCSSSSNAQTSRSKRRKNQQKRIVCEVPVEDLTSDMWAWRKYGQKPIKGSPYPRGYYRCSSSKGCPARKQVERNRCNPALFIITYTAEHNHPQPTHRNSLAGSTRSKTPSSDPSTTTPCKASMEDQDTEMKMETEKAVDDDMFLNLDQLQDSPSRSTGSLEDCLSNHFASTAGSSPEFPIFR